MYLYLFFSLSILTYAYIYTSIYIGRYMDRYMFTQDPTGDIGHKARLDTHRHALFRQHPPPPGAISSGGSATSPSDGAAHPGSIDRSISISNLYRSLSLSLSPTRSLSLPPSLPPSLPAAP